MSKVWCQAVYPLKAPHWGWAVWPEGEPAALVRGKASSEQDARQRSSEAIAEASKPADPAWMVEVAREARAIGMDAAGMRTVATTCRTGDRDDDAKHQTSLRALRLALERGHVVEPRPMPSEEDLLTAAREDAAQAMEQMGHRDNARFARLGQADQGWHVQAALQARRNTLREMGARPSNWMPPVKEGLVAGSMPREMEAVAVYVDRRELPADVVQRWNSSRNDTADALAYGLAGADMAKPGSERTVIFYREGSTQAFDLKAALKRAWDAGFIHCRRHGGERPIAEDNAAQGRDVSSILSTLPAKE